MDPGIDARVNWRTRANCFAFLPLRLPPRDPAEDLAPETVELPEDDAVPEPVAVRERAGTT